MVLENLGERLREGLKKIARSMVVDEAAINNLIKDIQRALLQADVDVSLVLEITKKIKDRAMKEKDVKGLDLRERIVNIVYNELVTFLGDERSEIIIEKKKPFKIMMVGVYGAWKCVHPDSNILLNNGTSAKIKEVYDEYSNSGNLTLLEDGEVIDISSKNLLIPSFNPKTLKIETRKATHLWKLKGKELLDVQLDNGNDFSVRVTPEHPFFVLKNGYVEQVRADELNEDCYIAVPNEYPYESINTDLFCDLKKLDLDIYVEPSDAKKYVLSKYFTIKNLHNNLVFKRDYCKLTMNIKKGRIPISVFDKPRVPAIKIKTQNCNYPIFFPLYLSKDLSEFLGYLIGDGHLERSYVQFTNQDEEVIKRFITLSENVFGITPIAKRSIRSKNLFDIRICSKTLVNVLNKLFGMPIGKKGKFIRIPSQVLESNTEILRSFIRAYFDCDAFPGTHARYIEITSESNNLIKDTYSSLLKFGIISTISKKYVGSVPYWRLSIHSEYAERYSDKVGFSISYKSNKVKSYSVIGHRQGSGKQDIIPVGSLLENVRASLGYSIGGFRKYVSSYNIYEKKGIIFRRSLNRLVNFYSKKNEGNTFGILNFIRTDPGNLYNFYGNSFVNGYLSTLSKRGYIKIDNGSIQLTKKGNFYLTSIVESDRSALVKRLDILSTAQVSWVRVRDIKRLNYSGYVYDLTVLDTHSFIADGIIVHNTTTIGKLAKFYHKRGYKVAAVGLDVHRPAAPDQLKQICDSIKIPAYIDKEEKNALRIYKKYEKEFAKYDILIIDTAGRHGLDQELVQEIKEISDGIKPDEKILVVSADIGQAAQKLARGFHDACGVTGIIITKLDGTARGGGALSGAAAS